MKHSLSLLLLALPLTAAAQTPPVSFYHQVVPIFKKSCTGCHHPGKMKGDLDLTTYEKLLKGGKGGAGFVAGKPQESPLFQEISGTEPSMPKEGDPLSKAEVALIERWIAEGAKNDTPEGAYSFKLSAPPTYTVPPVVSALAISPDGTLVAISGYHEVLLWSADGGQLAGRLLGESPKIDAIAFSPDGTRLATAGGAPSLFGEIQIWDVASRQQLKSFKISNDSLYGVTFSPDGKRVAFGAADKTARMISVEDGKELMRFDNHTDWVFGTTFTADGKRLLTGSRDKAMKLIHVENGQFLDDINKLLEGVLCIARHPKEDLVAYGGELGTPRIYRIQENQSRTAANNDVNLVRAFERQPGPVRAVAFSPDGSKLAVGSQGAEVRIYATADGKRLATLQGHEGAVFSIVFHPSGNQVITGGLDGKIRIFDPNSGALAREFIPAPLQAGK
jgi:WD40 repeat protein